ncbi:MAG: MATE family efflux transporter, partial [Burkholderiales bacterium]
VIFAPKGEIVTAKATPDGYTEVARVQIAERGSYTWPSYADGNIFVRTLCLVFAFAWFNAQGASLGDLVLAVNAVLLQMLHLLAYGLDGFAHAAEALVGSAVGRRSRAELRAAMRVTTLWAAATALGYALAYAGFADAIVALLTTIEPVRVLARSYTPWIVLLPLVAVWSYQLDGIFIGALYTREMRDAMIASLLVFLAASTIGLAAMGNHGLWLALAVFFVARALTLGAYLLRREFLVSPG